MNATSPASQINPLAVELETLLNRVPGDCPTEVVHESRTAGKGGQANLVVSVNQPPFSPQPIEPVGQVVMNPKASDPTRFKCF